jgi:electron transfer flavoprotein alpha/beta subunit
MRILVCLRQAGCIYYPIAIASPGGDFDPEKMVYMTNPYNEVAMEEAMNKGRL